MQVGNVLYVQYRDKIVLLLACCKCWGDWEPGSWVGHPLSLCLEMGSYSRVGLRVVWFAFILWRLDLDLLFLCLKRRDERIGCDGRRGAAWHGMG